MKKLTYKIVATKEDRRISIQAKPSEWGCHVRCDVTLAVPSIDREQSYEISWSCGARKHQVEDARAFFRAGLRLCDAAEKTLKALAKAQKRKSVNA